MFPLKSLAAILTICTVTGIVVVGSITLAVLIGTLWGLVTLITMVLAHTTSTELLMMLVLVYGAYSLLKKYNAWRECISCL